jgi:hypothetical protein
MARKKKDRDELFDLINSIFGLIYNKDRFYHVFNIKKKEYVVDFILKYYTFINRKIDTSIPMRIFFEYLKYYPIFKRSDGNIIQCNKTHDYIVLKHLSHIDSLEIVYNGNTLTYSNRKYINSLIRNLKILISDNKIKKDISPKEVSDIFKSCDVGINVDGTDFTRYSSFNTSQWGNLYSQYLHIISFVNIPQVKDRYKQFSNFIIFITQRLDIGNGNNEIYLKTIIKESKEYMEKTDGFNNVCVIFATLFLLYFNGHLDSIDNLQKYKELRKSTSSHYYKTVNTREICNIFQIGITTISNMINQMIENDFLNEKKCLGL